MKGGLSPRNPVFLFWVAGVCAFLICSSAASWPRLHRLILAPHVPTPSMNKLMPQHRHGQATVKTRVHENHAQSLAVEPCHAGPRHRPIKNTHPARLRKGRKFAKTLHGFKPSGVARNETAGPPHGSGIPRLCLSLCEEVPALLSRHVKPARDLCDL